MTTPEPQVDVALCERLIEAFKLGLPPPEAATQLRALLADRARHTAALKELVRLKRLKERIQSQHTSPLTWAELTEEYRRCKPLAWQAASAIVDGLEK